MIYQAIWNNLPYLAEGAAITIALAVTLLAIGLLVGGALGLTQTYGAWPLRWAATLIERLFRAIPAVVLLFLFYYGITALRPSTISPRSRPPRWRSVCVRRPINHRYSAARSRPCPAARWRPRGQSD